MRTCCLPFVSTVARWDWIWHAHVLEGLIDFSRNTVPNSTFQCLLAKVDILRGSILHSWAASGPVEIFQRVFAVETQSGSDDTTPGRRQHPFLIFFPGLIARGVCYQQSAWNSFIQASTTWLHLGQEAAFALHSVTGARSSCKSCSRIRLDDLLLPRAGKRQKASIVFGWFELGIRGGKHRELPRYRSTHRSLLFYTKSWLPVSWLRLCHHNYSWRQPVFPTWDFDRSTFHSCLHVRCAPTCKLHKETIFGNICSDFRQAYRFDCIWDQI